MVGGAGGVGGVGVGFSQFFETFQWLGKFSFHHK